MKRHRNLYPQITSFENLLAAAKQAQRGKRYRDPVLEFNANLEAELFQLQRELRHQTYEPGAYTLFEIYEPKRRVISAAPYRDRVVHHALCNVIVPLFDRTFIPTTYANRVGYGSHRSLKKFVQYARSSQYVLQCDICKYFPSIDIGILKQQIRLKLKCPKTLWLCDRILDNAAIAPNRHGKTVQPYTPVDYFPGDTLLTPMERPKGLPIGNLTSQFFANVYLNGFDHYVKEALKVRRYLRYVDDFALFSDDHSFLQDCRRAIETYLATLRLKIPPIKSQLFRTHHGANFVGFRVLGDHIRVRNHNLRRGRDRLNQLQQAHAEGLLGEDDILKRLGSWNAHLAHGDTWQLRQNIGRSLSPPWDGWWESSLS